MTFVPRVPLAPAETHVRFAEHNDHIIQQRRRVEHAALPAARRVAVSVASLHGVPSLAAVDGLAAALRASLAATARHGYHSAIAEITSLRAGRPVTAGWTLPDAGRYALVATEGLDGVLRFVTRRAAEAARGVADAAAKAALAAIAAAEELGHEPQTLTATLQASSRSLHNHVLELIGETLNLGRTAGATRLDRIPEFAMRSEQLDANTCAPCDGLHGTIVTVGSPEYFAVLPPTGCLGGGRCRGLMVFGDGPRDVRVPELLAA